MEQEPLVRALMTERAKVIGFIMVLIGGQDGAEDIFQDVCVLAFARRADIRDEAHLKAWLRLASRNLARNWLRKRNRHELPLGDIAAALGRPLGSLYVTFCRLHAALADCVRQRLDAGEAAHG